MRRAIVWTAAVLLCAATAHAAEPPKIAAIGDLPLERGGTIRDCRLEYRTLGTLNADRTNAVLFPTWFSGRTENLTGFVGADQMLDPARHFVILVGALGDGLSSSPSNSPSQPGAAFPRRIARRYDDRRTVAEGSGAKIVVAVARGVAQLCARRVDDRAEQRRRAEAILR